MKGTTEYSVLGTSSARVNQRFHRMITGSHCFEKIWQVSERTCSIHEIARVNDGVFNKLQGFPDGARRTMKTCQQGKVRIMKQASVQGNGRSIRTTHTEV